jgi:dihydroxyacetone kinase-like protein
MEYTSLQMAELIVKTLSEVAMTNQDYFSELDGVVGDGDFGNSIATGFREVSETKWESHDRTNPGTFLKDVASAFMGSVGGVSGSLWGLSFLRAGIKAGDKQELTTDDVIEMLWSAVEGMKKRGKSDIGDKTLLDAFIPAIEAFENITKAGGTPLEGLKKAAIVAREKTEEIKPWIAKRGRASYTGERSCNTYDAGSVAIAMMAEKLVEVFEAM